MANVCDFTITATGEEADLGAIVSFLRPAVEECKGGYYGSYVLNIQQLFDDVDERRELTFVGLEDRSYRLGNEEDRWYIFHPQASAAFTEKRNDCRQFQQLVDQLSISPADVSWHPCAATVEPTAALLLRGACKWGIPGGLCERLAQRFPAVEFLTSGCTEHELYETWIFNGSQSKCLEHLIEDFRGMWRCWYVDDGKELDPPEYEEADDDERF